MSGEHDHLADNIRAVREARGLSQQQIAKAAGIPRATWTHLESGAANPTLAVLIKVANALQIRVDELLAAPRTPARHLRADELPVRAFLNSHLPAVNGSLRYGQTCIYTLTPDRHFLIDLHPEYRNVAVAGGFSGHGFKFAPVVGEVLADLVDAGRTAWPVDMFGFARLAAMAGGPPSP